MPTSPPRPLVQGYGQSVHLFLAAVAQGMSLAAALVAFAHVGRGYFSHDGKCFFPENAVLGPVADRIGLLHGAECRVFRCCEGEADMTLLEARDAWASELGTLDAVTHASTRDQLVMLRVSSPSQQTALRNHPSWETDYDTKRALGPVISKWLASGVLEYVAWDPYQEHAVACAEQG